MKKVSLKFHRAINLFMVALVVGNSAFAARTNAPSMSCQNIFNKGLVLRNEIQSEADQVAFDLWRKHENRPEVYKRLFKIRGSQLHKAVYKSIYKNYLNNLKANARKDLENPKILDPRIYLSLQKQARLLAAMESELFLSQRQAESGESSEHIELNKLYKEFVSKDSQKWKNFRRRGTEIMMSGLSFYYLHFPQPIKEVDLLRNILRNPQNDPEMNAIKDDFSLNGPTPENLNQLKMKLGALPEIERAINYALKAFKIFIIGTVLYYLILNGGIDDISMAFALSQNLDGDEIEKITEENFNTTTWIDINEEAWIDFVKTNEHREPTPTEIENHRKLLEQTNLSEQ